VKCLIIDADNTIWNGAIVEGKVKIKETSFELLKQVHKLGVKIIVCSKNDKEQLIKKLEEFDLMKYINDVYASWEPKHYMVKDILEKYKLSPYECLFVDDLIQNRKEVGLLTNVHVDYEDTPLMILKYFDTDRLKLQLQQENRIEGERKFKGNFKDFIKKSKLKVEIRDMKKEDMARVVTLCNRTNDYNAARNRYSDSDIKKKFESDNYLIYIAEADDTYGKYGKIAEAIIDKKPGYWFIEDIAISCRIWNRGVGKNILNHIINQAKENKVEMIRGIVKLNEDNHNMIKLYKSLGFKESGKSRDNITYYNLEI